MEYSPPIDFFKCKSQRRAWFIMIMSQLIFIFVGRMCPLAQKGQRGAAENAWRLGCPLAMPC